MRDIFSALASLEVRLRNVISSSVYAVARFTNISKSSADGTTDAVEGQPNEGTNEALAQDDVRRLSGAFGIWSVPPAHEPCLVVRAGGGPTNGVIVACGGTRYAPSGLSDGEVAIYNTVNGCTIKLDKNGAITITGATGQNININPGSGGNVVLNGGTLSVARLTDTVTGNAGPYPLASAVISSPGATNVKA